MKNTLVMIPKATGSAFWKNVESGARKTADSLRLNLEWIGPETESKPEKQIELVQDLISKGTGAICLAPIDSRILIPSVKAARRNGIPVVIFDSDLDGGEYESLVATHNLDAGKRCAETALSLIGSGKQVLMFRYMEGSASTSQREQGFLQGIAELGPDLTVTSGSVFAGATAASAYLSALKLLESANRGKDSFVVFCPNLSSTEGMLQALEEMKLLERAIFIGFDINKDLLEALRAGKIEAIALQDPTEMGRQTVLTAYAAMNNRPFAQKINIGIRILTRDNQNQPDVARLLPE